MHGMDLDRLERGYTQVVAALEKEFGLTVERYVSEGAGWVLFLDPKRPDSPEDDWEDVWGSRFEIGTIRSYAHTTWMRYEEGRMEFVDKVNKRYNELVVRVFNLKNLPLCKGGYPE